MGVGQGTGATCTVPVRKHAMARVPRRRHGRMPRRIGSKRMAHGRTYCCRTRRSPREPRGRVPRGRLRASWLHVARGSCWRRGVLFLISLLPVYHHLTLQRRDFRSNVNTQSKLFSGLTDLLHSRIQSLGYRMKPFSDSPEAQSCRERLGSNVSGRTPLQDENELRHARCVRRFEHLFGLAAHSVILQIQVSERGR